MTALKDIVGGLFGPVADIFKAREARKAAKEAASAKLVMAKAEDLQEVTMSYSEWEALTAQGLNATWKDEYVTVSIMSVFNLILAGGILAAFGDPRLLEGLGLAVSALGHQGVDIGFLLEAVALAAIGLSVWRRV